MDGKTECPACWRIWSTRAVSRYDGRHDVYQIECPVCGTYVVSDEAKAFLTPSSDTLDLTDVQRATLSHLIRTRRNLPLYRDKYPFVTSETVQTIRSNKEKLPTPHEQLRNLISEVGYFEQSTGGYLIDAEPIYAKVGCISPRALSYLAYDAHELGLLKVIPMPPLSEVVLDTTPFAMCRLTLLGWERWEEYRQGKANSLDGFIAMQFGNARLDDFVKNVIQNGVFEKLGRRVHRVDSPDKTRAGIIDNIMREAIEEAAFVLVDLSHGNKGAYWEAGLAEGLRKPVIYLCEKRVWEDPTTRPHFDVNHRTTIMWSEDKPDEFLEVLVKTIENSLR